MGLFGRDDRATPQPPAPQPAAGRPPAKPQAQPQGRPGEATLVARGSRLEGRLVADNDVEVHGEIYGTIEGKGQVLVAEGSTVEAALHSRVVVVAGKVVGDVSADDKIELRASAALRGNITAPRVVIQDGASFEGQVFMQKPDATKPPVAADTAAPTPAAPAAAKPADEPAQPGGGEDPATQPRNRR